MLSARTLVQGRSLFWAGFRRLHPDWELITWRDPLKAEDFELGTLFAKCRSGAELADLIRLEVLWRHGGVYVDADCEAVRALDPLLRYGFFIGTEDGRSLTNAVLGAEPAHPAIRAYMDAIVNEDRLSLERATEPGHGASSGDGDPGGPGGRDRSSA